MIVEQLGTTNNVLDRQKFDQHSVWLGRAFDNDVILSDEHVDGSHAKLFFDEEGRLWLQDLGSVNGVRRPRHKAHIERTEVRSGEVFLIGRSRIRVFAGSHPVAPAVKIRTSEVFLLWLGKPQVTVMLAVIFLAVKILGTWLLTIGDFRWSQVIERNLGEVMTFVALAVGVYFLSVLFRRGGNFLAHLSLLIMVFLLSSLFESALAIAVFSSGDDAYPLLDWLDSALGYLTLLVYLWSILYLAFHISLMRRTLISVVIVAVMIGVNNLPDDSMRRFITQQSFPLKQLWLPPALLIGEPVPAEAFMEDADALFGALDENRLEALAEREIDEVESASRSEEPGAEAEAPSGDEAPGPEAAESDDALDAENSE